MSESDRPELASFLRSRRERLRPEDAGLNVGSSRRRTPGLRREELAMLAGISVDYLVRLEQGRETNPSQSVLAGLSRALRLDSEERRHLLHLSKVGNVEPGLCPQATTDAELNETTRALLDQLDSPAFVLDAMTDLLAWNDAYDRLVRPLGLLDDERPNLLRYTFLAPASRTAYVEWEEIAREQVGNLRATTAVCGHDPLVMDLVGELSVKSPEFATLWADHEVHEKNWGVKTIAHPTVGTLRLRFSALGMPDSSARVLVVYLPADAATTAGLDELNRLDHPPLRVVASS